MQIPSPSKEVPDTSFVTEIIQKKGQSIFYCSCITSPRRTIDHCRRQDPGRTNIVSYPVGLFFETEVDSSFAHLFLMCT